MQARGVFLIDIVDEYIDFYNKDKDVLKKNINKIASKKNLDNLKLRIDEIQNKNETIQIIFLLARTQYLKILMKRFKKASFISWKSFRLDI